MNFSFISVKPAFILFKNNGISVILTMKKDLKILVLLLAIPLLLFGTGYAYAQQTTSSYLTYLSVDVPAGQSSGAVDVYCDTGDFATGGASAKEGEMILNGESPLPQALGATPWGWRADAVNPTEDPLQLTVYVVCMSPITIAGIGVPEFGSIYILMIIGAAVYLVLTKTGKLQLKLVPTKN